MKDPKVETQIKYHKKKEKESNKLRDQNKTHHRQTNRRIVDQERKIYPSKNQGIEFHKKELDPEATQKLANLSAQELPSLYT